MNRILVVWERKDYVGLIEAQRKSLLATTNSKPLTNFMGWAGYFPFTILGNFRLEQKITSPSFLWTVFLILILLLDKAYWAIENFRGLIYDDLRLGNTRAVVLLANATFERLLMWLCRVYLISTSGGFLAFRESNLNGVEGFLRILGLLPNTYTVQYARELQQNLNRILKTIFTSSVLFLILNIWTEFESLHRLKLSSFKWYLSIFLCTLRSLDLISEVLFVVHIMLFLKIYCACLNIIADELKQVAESLKKVYNGRNEHAETRKIEGCTRAYFAMEDLILRFGSHFGVLIVFQVGFTVFFICIQMFFIANFIKWHFYSGLAATLSHLLFHVWKLFFICSNASSIQETIGKVAFQIYRLDFDRIPMTLQVKLQVVAQKIVSDCPKISPLGLFTLDRRFLATVTMSIATYFVIIMQFQTADDTSKHCNCTGSFS